ncbi:MAG: DUF4123 domain-containing protein [Litoreibacter sp.]|uniref:DUF4123 domain-containing protein n=1 Tax=Litoreibacter sp. TaxID=1969459 RepID=UPI003296C100
MRRPIALGRPLLFQYPLAFLLQNDRFLQHLNQHWQKLYFPQAAIAPSVVKSRLSTVCEFNHPPLLGVQRNSSLTGRVAASCNWLKIHSRPKHGYDSAESKVVDVSQLHLLACWYILRVIFMQKTVIADLPVASPPQFSLDVECYGPIEPLTSQFGQIKKTCVPEALRDIVFASEFKTYAVLDAAAIPGLVGLLSTSGLPHVCLFQSDTADALEDVAPWLVELSSDNNFTRSLFTKGRAPWEIWGKPKVLLLQSAFTLIELRAHFRKFTRIRDETGRWLFFRFWEVPVLRYIRKNNLSDELPRNLIGAHQFMHQDVAADGSDCFWIFSKQTAA